jgi:hypothetical protein
MTMSGGPSPQAGSSRSWRIWVRDTVGNWLGVPNTPHTPPRSPEDGVTPLGRRLAAGAAIATGLLAALGITGGQLDRLLRNEPGWTLLALALIGVGVLTGVAIVELQRPLALRPAVIAIVAGAAVLALVGAAAYRSLVEDSRLLVLGLLVAAVLAAAVAIAVIGPTMSMRATALIGGLALFLSGLVILSVVSVMGKSSKERPRVSGSIVREESGWLLDAHVSAQGFSRRDQMLIMVEGLNYTEPLAGRRAGRMYDPTLLASKQPGNDFLQTLALARVGPDSDGKIDAPIKLPISLGLYDRVRVAAFLETKQYISLLEERGLALDQLQDAQTQAADPQPVGGETLRSAQERAEHALDVAAKKFQDVDTRLRQLVSDRCEAKERDRTCIVLTLPERTVRPLVTIGSGEAANTVSVRVRVADVSPDDVVDVQVSTKTGVVWAAHLSAASSGALDESVKVPLPASGRVCAAARILEAPALAAAYSTGQSVMSPEPSATPQQAPRGPDGRDQGAGTLNMGCPARTVDWQVATAELVLPAPAGKPATKPTTAPRIPCMCKGRA